MSRKPENVTFASAKMEVKIKGQSVLNSQEITKFCCNQLWEDFNSGSSGEENKTKQNKPQNRKQPDNVLLFSVMRPEEHCRKHPCSLINDQPLHISQRCTQLFQIRNN